MVVLHWTKHVLLTYQMESFLLARKVWLIVSN